MLSVLTYPIEQPYRIKWMAEMFYAGSVVLIIFLTVFNVALVGYESDMIMISDPNITDYKQWWAPESLPDGLKLKTTPGECEDARLPPNTPLRTNSSIPLFSYTLLNNFNHHDFQGTSRGGLREETPYQANPLNTCHVQNMSLTMEPRMLSFAVSTSILCDPTGEPPRARRFQTSFRRADDPQFRVDSILDYMAYRANPNDTSLASYHKISSSGSPNDTFLNVLGVVDALGSDLIQAMYIRKATWLSDNTTASSPVPELGYMAWDSRPDARIPTDPARIINWKTYTEGFWDEGEYIRTLNASVINMFVAVRDAINLDIGNITSTNIYVNKTAFNSMITPDKFVPTLIPAMLKNYPDDFTRGACSWAWGCAPNTNTSWAQALISTDQSVNNLTLPIAMPAFVPPSVIDMVYQCPVYKRKPWGNLLVSVFAGTFTMYAAIHGIFASIGPELDRRFKGPHFWEQRINQDESDDFEAQSSSVPTLNAVSIPFHDSYSDDDDAKKSLLSDDAKERLLGGDAKERLLDGDAKEGLLGVSQVTTP